MLTCRQTAELVSKRLDTRLTLWQSWSLRLHLARCSACSQYQRQIEALHALLRLWGRHSFPCDARLSDSAKDRIRASLAKAYRG